jgi:hypothetical protein
MNSRRRIAFRRARDHDSMSHSYTIKSGNSDKRNGVHGHFCAAAFLISACLNGVIFERDKAQQ